MENGAEIIKLIGGVGGVGGLSLVVWLWLSGRVCLRKDSDQVRKDAEKSLGECESRYIQARKDSDENLAAAELRTDKMQAERDEWKGLALALLHANDQMRDMTDNAVRTANNAVAALPISSREKK